MHILIVTPAKPGSRHGNRNTALRWARLLRARGHGVAVVVDPGEAAGARFDLMLALHARRSADAVAAWKSRSDRPLVLALTGTDLYRDIREDAAAQRSMVLADAGTSSTLDTALPAATCSAVGGTHLARATSGSS